MTNLRPLNNNMRLFNRHFMDMNDMIDSFFKSDFPASELAKTSSFKVDIKDEDDHYLVEAELPGFTKDQIQIDLEDGRLRLSAELSEEEENKDDNKYIHRERRYSKMSRTMQFQDIDEESVTASLEKGLLTISLPKVKEEEKENKRTIAIDEK